MLHKYYLISNIPFIQEKESEVTSSDTTKANKTDNQTKPIGKQQVESSKNSDETKEDKSKSVVDTDMLLNDNGQADEMTVDEPEQTDNNEDGGQADDAEQEGTEETETADSAEREAAIREQENSAQVDNSDQEDVMQVDEETSDTLEKTADNAVDNKARDLDIESMLAAIHNDNPSTDSADTQNSV